MEARAVVGGDQNVDQVRDVLAVKMEKKELASLLAVIMMRLISIQQYNVIFFGDKMIPFIIESQFAIDNEKEDGVPAPGLFDAVLMIAQEITAADHIYIIVTEDFRHIEITHVGTF